MPLSEKDAGRLWDMLSAAREAQAYTDGMSFEQYVHDRKTQRSVERAFEILGEAANAVSREVQQQASGIDWSGIIGLRNILAHQYGKVQQDRVWHFIKTLIPVLIVQLERLVPDPEKQQE